ncbi:hypothetical protein PSY30_23650, partial [Shigella flexneri]|nr:hypothetical protein [Shigella flexneri]
GKDPINKNELLLQMHKKFFGWKANTLSRAGKLVLLKANISGMPNHMLSCFKCPSNLNSEIDSACSRFL